MRNDFMMTKIITGENFITISKHMKKKEKKLSIKKIFLNAFNKTTDGLAMLLFEI